METDKKPWDQPISPELAKEYVANYMNNENFKPADFQAFYFHEDEIKKVLSLNKGKEYIKFTLGMKKLEAEGFGDKLYGCVMMTSSNLIIPDIDLAALNGENDIYDLSRPVPPYPPTE